MLCCSQILALSTGTLARASHGHMTVYTRQLLNLITLILEQVLDVVDLRMKCLNPLLRIHADRALELKELAVVKPKHMQLGRRHLSRIPTREQTHEVSHMLRKSSDLMLTKRLLAAEQLVALKER